MEGWKILRNKFAITIIVLYHQIKETENDSIEAHTKKWKILISGSTLPWGYMAIYDYFVWLLPGSMQLRIKPSYLNVTDHRYIRVFVVRIHTPVVCIQYQYHQMPSLKIHMDEIINNKQVWLEPRQYQNKKDFKMISWIAWASFWIRSKVIQLFYT